MCGISVYFNRKGISQAGLRDALASLSSLSHRGPDGEGVTLLNVQTGQSWRLQTPATTAGTPQGIMPADYQDGQAHLVLGHRRLSIFDLSPAGHQPMSDEAGNWLSFNGEVYNFPEIKAELSARGLSFRTQTDTEVILAAYRVWGPDCLKKFNGMWGMVLWDAHQRKLLVTNDRFGVKGLYYHCSADEFIAASEIKAILAFKGRSGPLHEANIRFFLDSGFLDTGTGTFFRDIHRFPPAHFAFIDPANAFAVKPQAHWTLPTVRSQSRSDAEWIAQFREVLFSAVRLRMRSDRPWGVSLSGGLDSSSVVYAARDLLAKEPGLAASLETYSCIFPGREGDESAFIHFIEKDTGVAAHHVNPMDSFTLDEFKKHIWHQDYPVSSTSMFAEWCLMKLTASTRVRVLLTGQGGDELLAGYHHHFYRYLRELQLSLRRGAYRQELKAYAELKEMPLAQLRSIARGEVKQFLRFRLKGGPQNPEQAREAVRTMEQSLHLDFFQLMLPTYLRSEDRDSMAFGVETRVPFLDYRMVELAAQMPASLKIRQGWQKWILRESMQELPASIRWRKDKKGYSNPQQEWVSMHADGFLDHLSNLAEIGMQADKSVVRKQLSGGDHYRGFWLCALSLWLDSVRQR